MAIDFTTGVLQTANFILAIVAGLIAASLFSESTRKALRPWRPLAIALIFFALEEIFGALRSFNIYTSSWITHVIPSVIMVFLIAALVMQIMLIRESGKK